MRIPPTENPRFPGPGSSSQGQSGPKARPKGVVDGHQANIPGPVGLGASDDAAKLRRLRLVVEVGRKPGCPFRKVWAKVLAEPPRKVRPPFDAPRPVPQTDTGG